MMAKGTREIEDEIARVAAEDPRVARGRGGAERLATRVAKRFGIDAGSPKFERVFGMAQEYLWGRGIESARSASTRKKDVLEASIGAFSERGRGGKSGRDWRRVAFDAMHGALEEIPFEQWFPEDLADYVADAAGVKLDTPEYREILAAARAHIIGETTGERFARRQIDEEDGDAPERIELDYKGLADIVIDAFEAYLSNNWGVIRKDVMKRIDQKMEVVKPYIPARFEDVNEVVDHVIDAMKSRLMSSTVHDVAELLAMPLRASMKKAL